MTLDYEEVLAEVRRDAELPGRDDARAAAHPTSRARP